MLEDLTDDEVMILTEMVINKGMYRYKKESKHYKWYCQIAMKLLEETIKRKKLNPCNDLFKKYTPELIAEFMEAKLKTSSEVEPGS